MADGNYKPSGGSTSKYTGPGSSWKQHKAVGVGQDAPKKGESKAAEKTEAKAEKKEDKAISDLKSAQKMEKGVGAGAGRGRMSVPPSIRGAGPPMIGGGMPGGPPMAPPVPGGSIPPAGRRPGKVARKIPTSFRRGK